MSLTNPTAVVTALANKLAACAAWTTEVGAGNESARIWYPLVSGSATKTHALIEVEETTFTRIAEGARSYPSGTAAYVIYRDASTATTGTTEALAEDLCEQLMALETGLYLTSASHSVSAVPDQAEEAAENAGAPGTYTIVIDITFGLET